ncbi:hypothetical protein ACF1AX_31275 [Streptomyces sp. NPDC014802]|uniref:hypothetical protein n=1 Tax=Streptomyces sp. NPDC014802 TaxID=3364917 RepID=UPI0036FC6D69
MATGPEHYRQAEELLDLANTYDHDSAPASAERCRKDALVHALLANAAATALSTPDRSVPPRVSRYAWAEWQQAAGVQLPEGGDL